METATFSILLPAAANDAPATLRVLQAITRLPEGRPFEVLIDVADDDDQTRMLVGGLEGDVRVLFTPSLTGDGDAFDRLAAAASTATLVLLTATAVPADGWSEALVVALDGADGALPRSLNANDGAELSESHWLALAVRAEAYIAVGGFAGTREAGRAEKASLLTALGTVASAPTAVFLQS